MSLDCYPLGEHHTISLDVQPMAIDVAYEDNLFVSTVDGCQSIAIYDLEGDNNDNLIRKFSCGENIVVDQILYCQTGNYLAYVGHREGQISLYVALDWKRTTQDPKVIELNIEQADTDNSERRVKLNCINCCQKTGNLAVCFGDRILIYEYVEDTNSQVTNTDDSFRHIITIDLSFFALKIHLQENYLSVTAVDHVQILKLELLTLQIQSDGLDVPLTNEPQVDIRCGTVNNISSESSGTDDNNTTCSNTLATSNTTLNSGYTNICDPFNNSDMSIITTNRGEQYEPSEMNIDSSNQSADDCITWNLNTKKLVKLPTLMHNTSTNLSSFHVCHPLELLGPASESIACRVKASIYSPDFCQNQLEAVVLLCKQFDFYKDPVKDAQLQLVYLRDSQDRFSKCSKDLGLVNNDNNNNSNNVRGNIDNNIDNRFNGDDYDFDDGHQTRLLKSKDHDLLASVACLISTLTHCFVYNLHGKKVTRMQTITHPDLCLDLRSDLLNIYILTPLGLQVCSSGICDSTFRYDWSSSGDLNLSFLARDRVRVLTSSNYVILVSSSMDNRCIIEYMEKPCLSTLNNRIVYTISRCNSISIRTNLLTYLHAQTQLALLTPKESQKDEDSAIPEILKRVTIMLCKQLLLKKQTNVITNSKIDKAIKHLLDISMCDLLELMKRHMDSLRDDDLANELDSGKQMSDSEGQNSLSEPEENQESVSANILESFRFNMNLSRHEDLIQDPLENPIDLDYELIRIYLKHAKFSQSLLDFLIENSSDKSLSSRLIGFMFEHNPRLLIKCAQRYPLKIDRDHEHKLTSESSYSMLINFVEKLKQLAEFDSTGINRATVLFTLAILYNTLDEKQKCLSTLDQIKPLNHLAITMSSNYELSHSIAQVVYERYTDVFNLFLNQLAKRDIAAAREFSALVSSKEPSLKENTITTNRHNHKHRDPLNSFKSNLKSAKSVGSLRSFQQNRKVALGSSIIDCFDDTTCFDIINSNDDTNNETDNDVNVEKDIEDSDTDEGEIFEQKLRLVADIPTGQLIELLNQTNEEPKDELDRRNEHSLLEASINLLESQFILARLRENSH